ncbi:MAG: methyl-accepting chemotaxis protein [Gammaproteobacteria bacterium]|nr:methyl-accepting chemotaxis protein [Gammaproteobacteria bacterium]MDH4314218.1 methyl-accepting chemotaxis protein [Gammaproteobacteria bacterium]MDH5213249.1 methyl-accepting chemotaxis protein [Gammaproteobacteria bacterium]MDH5499486.1 methyl-accepting chemotaxis protein [Gammaproteobacteria bacterium]
MANKSKSTSAFTVLASMLAVSLIVVAGIVYLQSGRGSASGSSAAELAALSQAIPRYAADAIGGDAKALSRLDGAVKQLAVLRNNAGIGGLPGGAGAWRDLDQHAQAILDRQADIEAIISAQTFVGEHMLQMLIASDELLDNAGSTAVIQQFQQRGAKVNQELKGLMTSPDPAAAAAAIATDISWMRQVTNALGGAANNLDIRALDAATREASLVPVVGELSDIEAQVNGAVQAATNIEGVNSSAEALSTTAGTLLDAVFSGGDSASGGMLANPMLPLGIIGVALLLLAGLAILHGKSTVFERTSREQSEQNERNQQAILRLLDELGSLADGDLTVEATVTEDITGAIADSINYAIEKLRELVATINETAIMVDSAAKQTESTALHMKRAAENQNREISAATGSIVSMAGSIEEVSGNAERSSDVARHSVEVAHKGGAAVRRTIDGMNAIRETIQDTSKRIKRLGESSQEIGNIVELINDIAEQTNILALNASIQASMAGEAGRGFAVVADEVQRLAERSTNATKQIEVLVRTIQADTNEAVVSMERSTTDVVGGALLAENAGAALDEIEQVSNQIANLVQNISGSARQQASSAADVTRRTTKLKEISDQAGKATTATAASISKLSELASQLRKTVAGFTLPNSALKASRLTTAVSKPPPQSAPQAKKPQSRGKAIG